MWGHLPVFQCFGRGMKKRNTCHVSPFSQYRLIPQKSEANFIAPWRVKQVGYHSKGTSIFPMIIATTKITSSTTAFLDSLPNVKNSRYKLDQLKRGLSASVFTKWAYSKSGPDNGMPSLGIHRFRLEKPQFYS